MAATLQQRPDVTEAANWTFPTAKAWQLACGARGEHIEVAGCGLLSLTIQLLAPLSGEPSGRDGITDLLARCLLEGTTPDRDAREFAAALNEIGAEFHAGTSVRGPRFDLQIPASQAAAALRLLADVLKHAHIPHADLNRMVANNLDDFAAKTTDARARAAREFYKACFTPDSRLSRPSGGTPDTVGRISHADATGYWTHIAVAGRARLLSAGDLAVDQLRELAETSFGSWHGAVAEPPAAHPTRSSAPSFRLVDRPGSVQTAVHVGAACLDEHHPDYADLEVASYVLGVPLNSRLSTVLREEKGYTYGVQASVRPSLSGGTFAISTLVDAEVTVPALRDTYRVIAEFRDHGMTSHEHQDAVAGLLGSDPISFQTPDRLARQLAHQIDHDLPTDWLEQHRDAVAATTADSARAAYLTYVPAALTTVLVGDAASLEPQLIAAGWTVEVVRA